MVRVIAVTSLSFGLVRSLGFVVGFVRKAPEDDATDD